MPKQFLVFGQGFSGDYETLEEAQSVISVNDCGSVYIPLENQKDLIYVPGDWLCPLCHFRAHQRTLYAQTGNVAVNHEKPDNCPNDGSVMERLTWKQDAEAANQIALDLMKENRRLRERLDELETRH